MYHTQKLNEAVAKAVVCDCIICASCVINLKNAERLWKRTKKGRSGEWYRKLYRTNWKAAATSLLVLAERPLTHLKGAPYATQTQS